MQKGGTKRNPRNDNVKKLSIRVASGTLKGRKLDCPPGEIRPMTSMCKQALFNIMFGRTDMEMLDLFSGSASISIEGYSRGMVKSADVVEGDYSKKAVLNSNINKLGLTGEINPIISDAFAYIRRCAKKYDFIMLDPPFKMENKQSLLELLEQKELLKDNGIIVIHAKYTDSFDEQIGKLVQTDYRRYGINVLVFYQWKKNITEDDMGGNKNE